MNTKNDTRMAILQEAQDLVQRKSISGVSFQELAKKVGIKKGSMYYHFESKDDLVVEMLNMVSESLKEGFDSGRSLAPTQRLSNMLYFYRSRMCDQHKLCTGGVFASEWETLSEPVRTAVQNLIATIKVGVSEILQAGLDSGEFCDHGRSIDEMASLVVSVLQGGLVTARINESQEPFEIISAFVMSYLTGKPD